ncbi:hypothetical protein cyc_06172 [Cyclospora cayetanensis]|uniref:Uncharacterized protein n=1 Tax=Cyclospora cayetanensis TaxID=88456 RepID=A0A1D3CSH4_9EIME|nr:hypothetical protein cyc_06172 [Cyclospora cayetanensis]
MRKGRGVQDGVDVASYDFRSFQLDEELLEDAGLAPLFPAFFAADFIRRPIIAIAGDGAPSCLLLSCFATLLQVLHVPSPRLPALRSSSEPPSTVRPSASLQQLREYPRRSTARNGIQRGQASAQGAQREMSDLALRRSLSEDGNFESEALTALSLNSLPSSQSSTMQGILASREAEGGRASPPCRGGSSPTCSSSGGSVRTAQPEGSAEEQQQLLRQEIAFNALVPQWLRQEEHPHSLRLVEVWEPEGGGGALRTAGEAESQPSSFASAVRGGLERLMRFSNWPNRDAGGGGVAAEPSCAISLRNDSAGGGAAGSPPEGGSFPQQRLGVYGQHVQPEVPPFGVAHLVHDAPPKGNLLQKLQLLTRSFCCRSRLSPAAAYPPRPSGGGSSCRASCGSTS